MNQVQRSEQWRARIEDFKASGQTMSAWCAAQNLTIHQLKYWLRKTSRPTGEGAAPATGQWLSLTWAEGAAEMRQPTPLVVRIGQTAIEVRPDFDVALLRQVVRALESPC